MLNDKDGEAYYHQRMGELRYSKVEKVDNSNTSKQIYEKIKESYDKSAKLYTELNNKTGIAYIQKCKGDLEEKFSKCNVAEWFGKAVKNYYDAFMTYYENINWRGFANVMQAMNTCLRKNEENKNNENTNIILYNLAEECYRWLGDVRGLADTLDYEGHALNSIKKDLNKYMALGKWLESRELWSMQENKHKVKQVDGQITELKLLGGKSWEIGK